MVDEAVAGIDGLEAFIKEKVGRMATPDEIADTVIYLLSPRSSYMNGASVIVDSGLTLGI